jgi:hypothetical protein
MSTFVSAAELLDVPSDEVVRHALDRFAFLAFAEKLLPK